MKKPLNQSVWLFYLSLKFTGIEIQTPTARSRCLAGKKRVLRIAAIAASSNPVFGIPFKIIVGNADFVKGSYNNTEIDFLTNANRLTGVNTINF